MSQEEEEDDDANLSIGSSGSSTGSPIDSTSSSIGADFGTGIHRFQSRSAFPLSQQRNFRTEGEDNDEYGDNGDDGDNYLEKEQSASSMEKEAVLRRRLTGQLSGKEAVLRHYLTGQLSGKLPADRGDDNVGDSDSDSDGDDNDEGGGYLRYDEEGAAQTQFQPPFRSQQQSQAPIVKPKYDSSRTMNRIRDSFVNETTVVVAKKRRIDPHRLGDNDGNNSDDAVEHFDDLDHAIGTYQNPIAVPTTGLPISHRDTHRTYDTTTTNTGTADNFIVNDHQEPKPSSSSSSSPNRMPSSDRQDHRGQKQRGTVTPGGSGTNTNTNTNSSKSDISQTIKRGFQQIPAIALIGLFHLMIGIPFGVSYFPIGWRADYTDHYTTTTTTSNITTTLEQPNGTDINGPFPIPGKEALGIRMFLLSTIIGQITFTLTSGFTNPIGLQMVENVPFCHTLSFVVIRRVGYGPDALSTLLVMFGLSSVLVGAAFFALGYMELGNVVYFFPAHVMVGCIGGIGVFIAKTGIEVTTDASFSLPSIAQHWDGLLLVAFFEGTLRVLERVTRDRNGKPRYALLSPIYFCLITPVFYACLWIAGTSTDRAVERGYFFPSLDAGESGGAGGGPPRTDTGNLTSDLAALFRTFVNRDALELWTVIDLSSVSWSAIFYSTPTLFALVLFSLIHVPINIPAFAISTKTEADMNRELIAHGYSNVASGLAGGLQNYMAYTQSVVYDRSGGDGRPSGFAVAAVTSVLFFVGPAIASYLPRCMASTLLLHVGADLFLEGVYDSFGRFDTLEYVGIWVITVVMTTMGMDAAMLAGAASAVLTYAVQTVVHLHPVRGYMSAITLRSSVKNRKRAAWKILDDSGMGGRGRILVVQLQGHLFFGNVAQLNESVNSLLLGTDRHTTTSTATATAATGNNGPTMQQPRQKPWILIMDFSLVLGIDTSATQAIVKLRDSIRKTTDVTLCIFVTGSNEGFPCEVDLSRELSDGIITSATSATRHKPSKAKDRTKTHTANDETTLLLPPTTPAPYTQTPTPRTPPHTTTKYEGSHVFYSMDEALAFAENALISRSNPALLDNNTLHASPSSFFFPVLSSPPGTIERATALRYLENMCPPGSSRSDIEALFSFFRREAYRRDEFLWRQGSEGNCAKLLVDGVLLALLENEAGTRETIRTGNMIGELGLVMENKNIPRMSSVVCATEEAVVYSLSREDWEELMGVNPRVARFVDYICISYLANRVQHVSNRIFETRCLPI